ncbi:DNA polymerase III subunit alpha [Inhella gelatinilytica]|uniref:DNA polymerase III subunit alpha n=1 Tax=Inhella gelatinilytica TaxID=2795030 RepID=A0A931IYL1_9BURK|nr:DNA polymerase III subunit alpha [Inhella gelatinilytica]MBH9553380.1 DNA polymerase III subunit alpha [Inhella gelatinilytica]
MHFVHLRVHTEFAVVDGTLRIDDAVKAAAKDKQPALAVTDLGNLFGAVKFYRAARKKGVKPILGADCWLEPESAPPGQVAQPPRVLLLVQNRQGYLNLCELLSRAWVGNVIRNQACLKREWLAELNEGLICLSGFGFGPLAAPLVAGDEARADTVALELAAAFPGRFYVELQRVKGQAHERLVRSSCQLAARLGLPVVATHPVQFLDEEEYTAHEARVCIAEGDTLDNPKRVKRFVPDQAFKSQADMRERFADIPSAVANALAIAERCSIELVLGKPQLPDFPTPLLDDGTPMPMEQYFRQLSFEGLETRLQHLYPEAAKREAERPRYVERLEFELTTIIKMGFPGYFLIVADFITWAKANACPVGPGRGSGAGSLVAYALSITDLDPLAYNLLFERFLNPERVSMPDFDIDFCQGNRDRVIDYVKQKYGREAVSQIATFGTMAAKAALRDVGRVLGMSYGHVDGISKLIPAPPGKTVTLAKVPEKPDPGVIYARQEEPELERREAAEEEVATLLGLATQVEGMVRNIGMHAGGVLIAPGKITDFCPLYQQPGSDSAVSQYDKDDVEAIGLVKFDFLGLATLTILELAKHYITARHDQSFAYENLPLNDAKTYKLFSDGKTEAVFQFESAGMQKMLREAKPTRLEDLIALNAMFRPGPLENIPSFCARKNGKEKIEYPHDLLGQVLNETYGIFVYQEQVMQAAQLMGGYSLGGADLLRRAMGKKKAEEMAQHREIFRTGAAKLNIATEKADEVFDLMEKFAGYGFNKSHAAAYSLLAYHTGYIKVHYTAEFFAANMTIESDNTDKLKILLADARAFGIDFQPPCINRSELKFVPLGKKLISYGLGAIKGTGAGAIEVIERVRREGGPFKSLFDFCARMDRRTVNKRVVEALVKAGAFDTVHPDRERVLESVGLAFQHAEQLEANAAQGGLFDFADAPASEPELLEARTWGVRERLAFEKAAIGFYLTGHLFDEHATEVRRLCPKALNELEDSREPVMVSGIVSDFRVVNGARGRVAIFKLDDGVGLLEVACSGEVYDQNKDLIVEDNLLVCQATVRFDNFSNGLRAKAQQFMDLAGARSRFAKALQIDLPHPTEAQVAAFKSWVLRHPAQRVESEEGTLTRGLSVRWPLRLGRASGDVELGPAALHWPSDAALLELQHMGVPAQLLYR